MDKNGENQQADTVSPSQQSTPDVKFNASFTPEIALYITECQGKQEKPTVKGFATRIKTDVYSLWSWAGKKKKDEQGNITEQLARPNFNEALTKLYELEKGEEEEKLTAKQEKFCQLYATDAECFGNGTRSYLAAYGLSEEKKGDYANSMSGASALLRNPKIFKRINDLLSDEGLNDAFVDKQLLFVIAQHEDKSSKVAAIREYNKLKARIIDKIDHTTKGKELPTPIYGGKSQEPV